MPGEMEQSRQLTAYLKSQMQCQQDLSSLATDLSNRILSKGDDTKHFLPLCREVILWVGNSQPIVPRNETCRDVFELESNQLFLDHLFMHHMRSLRKLPLHFESYLTLANLSLGFLFLLHDMIVFRENQRKRAKEELIRRLMLEEDERRTRDLTTVALVGVVATILGFGAVLFRATVKR